MQNTPNWIIYQIRLANFRIFAFKGILFFAKLKFSVKNGKKIIYGDFTPSYGRFFPEKTSESCVKFDLEGNEKNRIQKYCKTKAVEVRVADGTLGLFTSHLVIIEINLLDYLLMCSSHHTLWEIGHENCVHGMVFLKNAVKSALRTGQKLECWIADWF